MAGLEKWPMSENIASHPVTHRTTPPRLIQASRPPCTMYLQPSHHKTWDDLRCTRRD